MRSPQSETNELQVQTILHVALDRFHRDGYAATSMRSVAAAAHVSIRALYEIFPSKLALLSELVESAHDGLLLQTEAAVAAAGTDPVDRLEAAVWAQCDYCARHPKGVLLAVREMHHLDELTRHRIAGKRGRQQDLFVEVVRDGAAAGVFAVPEPAVVGRALFDLCASVPGSLGDGAAPRIVSQAYCDLAGRMTGLGAAA